MSSLFNPVLPVQLGLPPLHKMAGVLKPMHYQTNCADLLNWLNVLDPPGTQRHATAYGIQWWLRRAGQLRPLRFAVGGDLTREDGERFLISVFDHRVYLPVANASKEEIAELQEMNRLGLPVSIRTSDPKKRAFLELWIEAIVQAQRYNEFLILADRNESRINNSIKKWCLPWNKPGRSLIECMDCEQASLELANYRKLAKGISNE